MNHHHQHKQMDFIKEEWKIPIPPIENRKWCYPNPTPHSSKEGARAKLSWMRSVSIISPFGILLGAFDIIKLFIFDRNMEEGMRMESFSFWSMTKYSIQSLSLLRVYCASWNQINFIFLRFCLFQLKTSKGQHTEEAPRSSLHNTNIIMGAIGNMCKLIRGKLFWTTRPKLLVFRALNQWQEFSDLHAGAFCISHFAFCPLSFKGWIILGAQLQKLIFWRRRLE